MGRVVNTDTIDVQASRRQNLQLQQKLAFNPSKMLIVVTIH